MSLAYTTSMRDIAERIGHDPEKLEYLFFKLPQERRYFEFRILKRSGKSTRKISAPTREIKEVQRSLLGFLQSSYQPPNCVHGFVHSKSILTNAVIHRGNEWVVKTDLKNFFPSIGIKKVKASLMEPPFNFGDSLAGLVAHMCCYRNRLPQGAPTSPLISNVVCRDLDLDVGSLASAAKCNYSRYCDDLTFSCQDEIIDRRIFRYLGGSWTDCRRITSWEIGEELKRLINSHGFLVNYEKSRVFHRSRRQPVTGLVVNEKVSLPREYRRNIRKALYIWEKFGKESFKDFVRSTEFRNRAKWKDAPSCEAVVRGRIQYLGAILGWNSGYYKQFSRQLSRLDPTFSPTTSHQD